VAPTPPPPVVSPPPAPPTRPLALKPKPHRRHPQVVRAAPTPLSRGAGGPARIDARSLASSVAFRAPRAPALAPTSTGPSRARLFFLVAVALGFLLVFASALPAPALRPAFVHEVIVVHRIDLALVGFSIVAIVVALYLLTG
jgi:hypothetical protein